MNTFNETAELIRTIRKFNVIGGLLKELFKTDKVQVSVLGTLTDAATVGIPTFVGSLIDGPVGAVAGAIAGTVILGVSKAVGYCKYKPLMTVIQEDLTEEERKNLYERIWETLNKFEIETNWNRFDSAAMDSAAMNSAAMDSAAMNSAAMDSAAMNSAAMDSAAMNSDAMDSAAMELKKIVEENPEAMETITNVVKETLAEKKMTLVFKNNHFSS